MLMVHSIADLDAVASGLALKLYLKNADIVAPDHINSEANKFLHFMEHKPLYLKDIAPSDYKFKILLDTNSKAMVPGAESLEFDCIIDHHSTHEDKFGAKNELIDNTVPSTCELIYPLFKKIDSDIALCLVCGIISDTARFKSAKPGTFRIIAELLPKCAMSYEEILELVEVKPDVSHRLSVLKACSSAKITQSEDIIVATSVAESLEAYAASELIDLGADFSFVGRLGKGTALISARMRPEYAGRVDLPKVMEEAAHMIGGTGGGHPCAAGATGKNPAAMQKALARCEELALSAFTAQKRKK